MGDLSVEAMDVDFAPPMIADDDVEAVARVLRSGWLTSGIECRLLEEQLCDYLQVEHVVSMASCTAALDTAMAHLALPRGSRVGVPTWTFVATALSAVHAGHHVVLLDVDEDDLNLSVESLDAALAHGGLDAVVGVHFAGSPLAPAVHTLCAQAGVPLVEDAAHALGASDHRGKVAGQRTAGACFSFYASKNLTSGEGGALATDDGELAAFARTYRLHGLRPGAPGRPAIPDLVMPGIKANLPDALAALARSQLTRFAATQAHRRDLVERYRELLQGVDGLRCAPRQLVAGSADHLMVAVFADAATRGNAVDHLARCRVATSTHFQPLHRMAWFAENASLGPTGVIAADAHAGRVLSLPLHAAMSLSDVDRVCSGLREAISG